MEPPRDLDYFHVYSHPQAHLHTFSIVIFYISNFLFLFSLALAQETSGSLPGTNKPGLCCSEMIFFSKSSEEKSQEGYLEYPDYLTPDYLDPRYKGSYFTCPNQDQVPNPIVSCTRDMLNTNLTLIY